MKTQQINKPEALKRLDQIENEAKELRKIIQTPQKITDRLKTFEDACEIEGIDIKEFYASCKGLTIDEIAYKKLKIIIKAANEGWKADWDNFNEYKYQPYFNMQSGFGFSGAHYDDWRTLSTVGSRLCFKSRELAEYTGKTFLNEYKEFLK